MISKSPHAGRWALVAALMLATLPATAQPPHGGHGPGPGHGPMDPEARMDRMFDRLGVNDDQRAQLARVFEEHHGLMLSTRDALRDAREALAQQIHAAEFDEAAVRARAADLAAIEADLAVARATHYQQLRRILTPEQLAEFEKLHQRRQEFQRHHPRRGPGGFGDS